jgi:hypothetical protein
LAFADWSASDIKARLGRSLAAIFGEIGQQRVHGFVSRRIEEGAAAPFDFHETGIAQAVEVKRKGICWDIHRCCDCTSRHAFGTCLNKKAESIEAIFLGESRKSGNGTFLFHISVILESLTSVKSSHFPVRVTSANPLGALHSKIHVCF